MKISSIVFFVMATMLAFAPMIASGAETYWTSRIKSVYPLGGGGFVLLFADRNSTCTNNGSGDPYFYVTAGSNGVTAEGLKLIYAAALSAAAQAKTVTIAWDNATASTNCAINRMSVAY